MFFSILVFIFIHSDQYSNISSSEFMKFFPKHHFGYEASGCIKKLFLEDDSFLSIIHSKCIDMIPQNRPTILRAECITFLYFITYYIFYFIMIQFFCIVDYFVTLRLTSIKYILHGLVHMIQLFNRQALQLCQQ